ncbi:MAG: NDP-sugar synthase [Ignavibacteriae bacterium]|nr:NDP-sugar synthase [Ignavibacteriota bacterium]
MKIKHALIMAAGRGMRMMPLTETIPKPMAPFMGSTLIANGINMLNNHIENIHITVGYKGAMLAKHVIENNVSSIFNTEGHGNCFWVYNTLLKYLNEPIYVLTSDNVILLDFEKLETDYYSLGEPLCMVVPVKPIEGLDGDYIFSDESKQVKALSRDTRSEIYCSGIQIINCKKINETTTPCENFDQLWQQLISQSQLYCSRVYPNQWYAVDTVQQLEDLENMLK